MAAIGGQLKTVVFLGSVREGRMCLRVAKFITKQLEAANHVVELFGECTFSHLTAFAACSVKWTWHDLLVERADIIRTQVTVAIS